MCIFISYVLRFNALLFAAGACFLGSHLVDHLIGADEEVILLGNFFTAQVQYFSVD